MSDFVNNSNTSEKEFQISRPAHGGGCACLQSAINRLIESSHKRPPQSAISFAWDQPPPAIVRTSQNCFRFQACLV